MPKRNQRANRFSGPDLLRYFIIIVLFGIAASIIWNERNKKQIPQDNNFSEKSTSQQE